MRGLVPLTLLVALLGAAPARADAIDDFAKAEGLSDVAHFHQTIDVLRRTGSLPPDIYVTKAFAESRGWRPGSDLCRVLPGKLIGGDPFGNFEGRLPRPGRYREADLDYDCGHRNAKRLVYSQDGQWVTVDHYESFQKVP